MQTMIAFTPGTVGLGYLFHENAHQWWGDNVSEADYRYFFLKEGFAFFPGQMLTTASQAETAAGGPYPADGQAAFEASLQNQFDYFYYQPPSFWAQAPSRPPTPYLYVSYQADYWRPAAAYIELRQILRPSNFVEALHDIQREYGGGTMSERQEEAVFSRWLPNRSSSRRSKLSEFSAQWFDIAYPSGGESEPQITGPGLPGTASTTLPVAAPPEHFIRTG